MLIGGLLFKSFYLNEPKTSPSNVTRQFIDAVNSKDKNKAKSLMSANYKPTKEDENLTDDSNEEDVKLITEIKEEVIDKDTASVIHEVDAILVKLKIQFKLKKEGDWISGYNWKIEDIILPNLGNDSAEKESLKYEELIKKESSETISLATIDYRIISSEERKEIKELDVIKPKEDAKFVVIKVSVKNKSKEELDFYSGFLQLISKDSSIYEEFDEKYISFNDERLMYKDVGPGLAIEGYLVYEIPESLNTYGVFACHKETGDCYYTEIK